MKKVIGIVAAVMLIFSSLAYAGGDQVCADKAKGFAGDDTVADVGEGETERSTNRGPSD